MFKKKRFLVFLTALAVSFFSVYFLSQNPALKEQADSFFNRFVRFENQIKYTAQSLMYSFQKESVELNVPFHKQEHALSCEIAALKMVLDFHGVGVSEAELLGDLKFDTILARGANNVWGDPDKGFVGDIDGKIGNGGYGVYESPIVDLALQYREAKVMENVTLKDVLSEVVAGRPVIVWGFFGSGKDISWRTPEGKEIKAFLGEHTRVVSGFSGTVENPKTIILMDPIYGKIKMSAGGFKGNWARLGNKAVVVY